MRFDDLVFVTSNPGKLRELSRILSPIGLELHSQAEFHVPEVPETGLSFVENALFLAPILFFIGFMAQTVIVQSVLSESVEKTQLDQVFGLFYTLGFTLGSFSSVIFGYVVETYGFQIAFSYIIAVTSVSIIPAFLIKE